MGFEERLKEYNASNRERVINCLLLTAYCSLEGDGGRYWIRTSDLFGVNEARYRCAKRPLRHDVVLL